MSERDPERDEAIAARARALLERSAEELDPVTRARLRAARLRALGAPRTRGRGRLVLAGAAIAALALVASISWWPREPSLAPATVLAASDAMDDVEILSASDDLELYAELDFYRWLAASEPI